MNNPQAIIVSSEKDIAGILHQSLSEKGLPGVLLTTDKEINNYLDLQLIPNYFFIIEGFGGHEFDTEKIYSLVKEKNIKTEIIVPWGFEVNSRLKEIDNPNLYIIYVGEIERQLLVNELLRGVFSYGFPDKEVSFGKKIEYVKPIVEKKIVMPEQVQVIKIKEVKSKPPRKKIKIKIKKIILILFFFVLLISLPFLTLFVSVISLKAQMPELAKPSSYVASKSFFYFDEGKKLAQLIYDYSEAMILAKTIKLEVKNLGTETLDVKDVYLKIDDLNTRVQYLLAEEKSLGVIKSYLPQVDLNIYAYYLENIKELARHIPQLMGYESKVNYLILVQDKKELWPTGGKIRKFAVVTMENGKITQKEIYENDALDKEIKGAIIPPLPLSRYLGLKNWNFSASNWEADFNQAAQRAIWFVDKGMGIKINGVMAIEENLYSQIGTSNNLHEMILEGLNSKDILVYFNDEKFYKPLSTLNWDGGVSKPKCSGNCYVFYTGTVAANLSGNAISNNITRSERLNLDFSITDARAELNIETLNGGEEGYKEYLTILGANLYKYTEIETKGQANSKFEWAEKHNIDFTKPGKIIIYVRKQPGSMGVNLDLNIKLPSGLTADDMTSYNTNLGITQAGLGGDFYKEIKWQK